jgi:hypothetical protein
VPVVGELQEFSGSLLRIVPPNGDFIYLQRIPASTIKQNNNGDGIYLQRFAACRDEPKDIIIWLMRARNTTNTKYIYWQSPRIPSTSGVDISRINESTIESVGSVYGPP